MRNQWISALRPEPVLKRFGRDERGATAIVFSVMLVPLMLFVGLGVDVARMEKRRHDNQIFLDNALISALARDGKDVSAESVQTFYRANGGSGSIEHFAVDASATMVSATADATSNISLLFGGFANKKDSTITVASEAKSPLKLNEMRIIPIEATGWYIKTLKLYVTRDGDPAPILLGTIEYRPSSPTSETGTMTSDFGDDYVSIENADKVWFEMSIDPSSEGLNGPDQQLNLRTDDPDTASNLFVDGQQMPQGRTINLADITPCGLESHHAWEDGGDFATQDFFYTVTGKCNAGGSGIAYVSK